MASSLSSRNCACKMALPFLVLAGCTAEIVVIPPPRVATTSQILGSVEQSEPEINRPKPKARSVAVRQTLFHLGQKASGTISGEFSQEYSNEFK
jgi:hypothetical protein